MFGESAKQKSPQTPPPLKPSGNRYYRRLGRVQNGKFATGAPRNQTNHKVSRSNADVGEYLAAAFGFVLSFSRSFYSLIAVAFLVAEKRITKFHKRSKKKITIKVPSSFHVH